MSMDRRSSSQSRLVSSGSSASFKKTRSLTGGVNGSTSRVLKDDAECQNEEVLLNIVKKYDKRKWRKIAEYFKDRKCTECLNKCRKFLNLDTDTTLSWTEEEDDKLVESVIKYGTKNWSTVAQYLPRKNEKQCQDRWHHHFDYNFEAWTREEDLVLIHYQKIHGNKWTQLTDYLPGRTKETINLYWHSCLKNKVDSYIKSGLLGQFKRLPPVAKNVPVLSSSIKIEQDSGAGRTIWTYLNQQQPSDVSHIDNLREDMIGYNNKNSDLILKPSSDDILNLTCKPNNVMGPGCIGRGTGKRPLEGDYGGGNFIMSSRVISHEGLMGRMQMPPASRGYIGSSSSNNCPFPNHSQEVQPNSQFCQQPVEQRYTHTTIVHRRRYSTSTLPNNANNAVVDSGSGFGSAFHHHQLATLQDFLRRNAPAGPSIHDTTTS